MGKLQIIFLREYLDIYLVMYPPNDILPILHPTHMPKENSDLLGTIS